MRDTTAPVKKATYKAMTIFGNPKKSPKKNASLTSPNPMPRPRVTIKRNKKNKNAPAPASTRLPTSKVTG